MSERFIISYLLFLAISIIVRKATIIKENIFLFKIPTVNHAHPLAHHRVRGPIVIFPYLQFCHD